MEEEEKLTREQEDNRMIDEAFQRLLNTYLASHHRKKVELITQAFNFARKAHEGVRRLSGEPYIMHPLAVAQIVSEEIGLGSTSICSALLHDVVEIDAGDTYAYDAEALRTQEEREEKAAKRIFGLLPEDQAKKMIDLFHEFEEGETAEARFARSLDNVQPVMLNDASGGLGWKEKNISFSRAVERQKRTPKGSRILWEQVTKPMFEKNIALGNITGDVSPDAVTED